MKKLTLILTAFFAFCFTAAARESAYFLFYDVFFWNKEKFKFEYEPESLFLLCSDVNFEKKTGKFAVLY